VLTIIDHGSLTLYVSKINVATRNLEIFKEKALKLESSQLYLLEDDKEKLLTFHSYFLVILRSEG
jgi:hypothetical protein